MRIEEMMLPMRDGVRLRTRIFKPDEKDGMKSEKALPAILERTCYPHLEENSEKLGEWLTREDYLFISQYCRGTGGSEGVWEPNVNERSDGLDTIHWLSDQQWIDCIGYWGNSYLALTGWAIADQVPEKVKGMCLTHYGTDRFTSAYEKGMFRQDVLTVWTMDNAGYPITADYIESCKYMPQIEVDERLWGRPIPWYRDYITNIRREASYWQQGWWKELSQIPANVKVPLYIRSGWYDHHHGSAMKTWDNLNQESKKHSWLDIGGWNHSFIPCLEDCSTENMKRNPVLEVLDWFDLVLKQKEKPQQRVRTYVIGADQWMEQPGWPVSKLSYEKLYFHKQEQEGYAGTLSDAPLDDTVISYEYDPLDPVFSYGSESLLRNMDRNGSLKQPEPGYRKDVISLISEPLRDNRQICGKMKVHLIVSSDCTDTAFTAKVMELRANGKAYNIRSSITSLSYDLNQEYVPNSRAEVTIEMWDVVYELKAGSRIRIDIASSDFPQYHIHSNYAGLWSIQDKTRIAKQKIYCGKKNPSRIEIPISL